MYVLDTATIIDLHQHWPASKVRGTLRKLVRDGQLKIPEGVFREVCRKSDKTKKMIRGFEKNFEDLVVKISQVSHLKEELSRIEQTYGEEIRVGSRAYPGFWKSPSGRRAADAQVVAVAKRFSAIVVSDDKAIQRACMLENLECIGWTEFSRRMGLVPQPCLPL